jgi:hypothetical protein
LEVNDRWLVKLVRRADAGETIVDADRFCNRPRHTKMIQTKKIEAFGGDDLPGW